MRGSCPVTVVIVNYNGRSYLDELLWSLREQSELPEAVWMLDNASTDGSTAYVRNNFPWVRVLAQERNLGFAAAGNLAARSCRTPYFALLNTDLRLERDWLAELVRCAREEGAAAVASKLRLYDRPDTLNGVGGAMNCLGYTWDRGMFEPDRGQYDKREEVLFASAGAALFEREAFLEVGGFDERFFMYHEDVDLGWRLWLLGYRVVTAPQAVAYHHFGGATRQSRGLRWRELLGERNAIRSLIKNYERRNLARALASLLVLAQPPSRKIQQLRNFAWNLLYLPETWRLRRQIQSRRRRSDALLSRFIVQSKHVPIRL